MGLTIPFVRQFDFAYGVPDRVSPLITRVIANNPGPFTFTGTGVYIVGDQTVAVIDPGPDDPAHFEALKRALDGRTVSHVLVTHAHMDHSPLAHPLARWAGCEVWASGQAPIATESEVRLEAGDDNLFRPDHALDDGQLLRGDGWTLEAIATSGHTSSHMCYALIEEKALFSGDHVMGWSTTVISPPDGDMQSYLDSLDRVAARGFSTIWPTHGPPITDPQPFLAAYRAHRLDREDQIVAQAKAGRGLIRDMVPEIYAAVDSRLWPAACHSVLAHTIRLVAIGRLACDGAPGINTVFRPA
ncbi:MAG: MBL fold metallo-hydrolase [Hyphomonadaceae bacterium]|jgi:glyoxylase-like metal-dependent hydrolase (beta-lactamase superfamily II)|nr:MBL fold metallo-hydrolase [Hyphomonadaceae bacterium]